MTLALESKQNHAKAKLLIMQLLDQVQDEQIKIAKDLKNTGVKKDSKFASTLLLFQDLVQLLKKDDSALAKNLVKMS